MKKLDQFIPEWFSLKFLCSSSALRVNPVNLWRKLTVDSFIWSLPKPHGHRRGQEFRSLWIFRKIWDKTTSISHFILCSHVSKKKFFNLQTATWQQTIPAHVESNDLMKPTKAHHQTKPETGCSQRFCYKNKTWQATGTLVNYWERL